jgi:sporulation protein YlmC with PRC-barrel domain
MLRSLKDLEQYAVVATDGAVGKVSNFLLDDSRWTIRYLVVDAGTFFQERSVLISPMFFRQTDWATRTFRLALATEKIKNSPSIDLDKPVSRQHERDYYRYYGYPYYWGFPGIWGSGYFPGAFAAAADGGPWTEPRADQAEEPAGDAHLRSAKEVCGYVVQGNHKEMIGHVQDFIVDDETWQIRYLVVDTSRWWFGKKVLVAPDWATRISWEERSVNVDLSRESVKNGPSWDPGDAVNRGYEARLYDYYGRPVYWVGDGSGDMSPRHSSVIAHDENHVSMTSPVAKPITSEKGPFDAARR